MGYVPSIFLLPCSVIVHHVGHKFFLTCLNYRLALNLSLLRNIRQFFLRLPSGNCPSTGNVLTGMVAVPGLCWVAEERTKNTKVLVGKLELRTLRFQHWRF